MKKKYNWHIVFILFSKHDYRISYIKFISRPTFLPNEINMNRNCNMYLVLQLMLKFHVIITFGWNANIFT